MKNRKKGFTLVELIIAMAVSAIVLLGVVQLFSSIIKMSSTQDDYVKAQDAIRTVGVQVESDIRGSSQSMNVALLNGCTVLTDTVTNQKVQYCLNGKVLKRNGSVVIEGVKEFSVTQNLKQMTIKIVGAYQERVINYEKILYLR